MIDLGTLGFNAKRFWEATPDVPEKTIPMRRALHVRGRVSDADTGRPITAFTLVPGYTWENVPNVWWRNEQAKRALGSLLRRAPEHGGRARGHPDRGRRLLAGDLAELERR